MSKKLKERPLLICSSCGLRTQANQSAWRCGGCGGLLNIEMESEFPLNKIHSRPFTMWRYREAIPIENDENIISLGEPLTPLAKIEISGKKVMIKMDHLFPTGSFKDRGASVLVSKMRELGITKAIEDSSGNAGAAVAAYCAAAGIECEIFIPAGTPTAKSIQIELYGASVKKIRGSREDTAAAALEAARTAYYASHCWNPFFIHGVKTFAFEVAEQLGWKAPDVVILPAGNGTLILGAFLGFRELHCAGLTDGIPKIIAVQAENCAPLYRSWKTSDSDKTEMQVIPTFAEGISVANPVRAREILECVRKSGGQFITVNENEIKAALKFTLTRGYFIEPTASAAIAGVKKYLSCKVEAKTIVSIFTGHGLKSPEKIRHIFEES
jgi:threonine synthase